MTELAGCDFCKFVNYESSDDFYLYEIGTTACVPGWAYEHFVHKRTIIHFVLRGKGKLYINNKEYTITEHQAFIIPENARARYQADQDDPWEYIWIHVGGPKLPELLKDAGLSLENPVFQPIACADEIETLARQLLVNYEREYYCIGLIYQICDYMITYSKDKPIREINNSLLYVKRVIAYIQLKYNEPVKIETIAFACGLNRSYLTRLFKDATGYSLQEYLLSYRVKKAQKLLTETDMPIQDIALAVGYGDSFTFSKAFKRQTGKSPRDYKRV